MKSEVVRAVFLDELERNKRLIARYSEEAGSLPQGSLFKRSIGGGEYFYLSYREGKKTVSKFVGKADSVNEAELRQQIARRKELTALLKKLRDEQKDLERELR